MSYLRERRWARWWVLMWAVLAPLLVVLAFFVPFHVWLLATTIGFGVPEAIGVARTDAYPPLTYVTRRYLPRWLAHTLIFGAWGTVVSYWLGFGRPFAFGALFALLGWLQDHFDDVYED